MSLAYSAVPYFLGKAPDGHEDGAKRYDSYGANTIHQLTNLSFHILASLRLTNDKDYLELVGDTNHSAMAQQVNIITFKTANSCPRVFFITARMLFLSKQFTPVIHVLYWLLRRIEIFY